MADDGFLDSSSSDLILRALFEGQRDLHNKIDMMQSQFSRHMRKDEASHTEMAVQVAKLEERVASQSKKWGMVSTIVTSMASALGVSFLVSHK